jgi:TatD DNase family protein
MTGPPPNPASLVDTHAHLADARLQADLPGVLERARRAGVNRIVAIGTTAASSREVLRLAHSYPGIFAAVGIHPNDAAESTDEDWPLILQLANQPGVVAVGETGLDRYWKRTPFEQQQHWFSRHLVLAHERRLPVVIHCRDCYRDVIEQLHGLNRPVRGVMHAFAGTWEDAQACLELGLHLSFAGMVTFLNRSLDSLREVAARVPLDRLLVETDSPYLSPHPFRGKQNEPAHTALTAERLAQIRQLSTDELARISTSNAEQLFQLPAGQFLSDSAPSCEQIVFLA